MLAASGGKKIEDHDKWLKRETTKYESLRVSDTEDWKAKKTKSMTQRIDKVRLKDLHFHIECSIMLRKHRGKVNIQRHL